MATNPPNVNTYGDITLPDFQPFRSYLPNAFDDNLTLLQKVNMVIQTLTSMGVSVNSLFDNWNNVIVPYVTGDGLNTDVVNKINTMFNDGSLSTLINGSIILNYGVLVGARQTGETDDTGRLQRAIDSANTNSIRIILLTEPLYQIKQITLQSNLIFISYNGSTIQCLDSGASVESATFISNYPSNDLTNIHFEGINFDGNRLNIAYAYYHIFGIYVNDGYTLKNLSFRKCHFTDAKQDFIRIVGKDVSAKADRIILDECTFNGVNVSNSDYAQDGLRIELNRYTNANYGYIFATNIIVKNCYAEGIRTLADLKRGSSDFVITNNKTYNMYDIDISTDGAFNGLINNNITKQDTSFTPIDSANAFEIQGENIIVSNNYVEYKKTNGIYVTDYGSPDEGGNIGHISKNITVINNIIGNVPGGAGVKSINGDNIIIKDNTIISSSLPIAVDSGTGRNDTNSNPLTAGKSYTSGNNYTTYTYGISLKGRMPILGKGNVDSNGQTLIQYNPAIKVDYKGNELNFNVNLEIDGTTSKIKYFNSGDTVTQASSKPLGALYGVTVQDTLSTSLGEVDNTDFTIPAIQNQIIHFGLHVKQNTATAFGLVVKEYSGTTFIKSTFLTIPLSTTWTRQRVSYTVTDPTCDNIIVGILPATNYNNNTPTGSTDIALFNISNSPVN